MFFFFIFLSNFIILALLNFINLSDQKNDLKVWRIFVASKNSNNLLYLGENHIICKIVRVQDVFSLKIALIHATISGFF
jgi:hypothetical protein